jgi:hypothetical protein
LVVPETLATLLAEAEPRRQLSTFWRLPHFLFIAIPPLIILIQKIRAVIFLEMSTVQTGNGIFIIPH